MMSGKKTPKSKPKCRGVDFYQPTRLEQYMLSSLNFAFFLPFSIYIIRDFRANAKSVPSNNRINIINRGFL
jgi:hypothetical protein